MRSEIHIQSNDQSAAPGVGDNSRHQQSRSMRLLERRQKKLVAGGTLGCDQFPLPPRERFCSVLLAEEVLKGRGCQDLGRQCPMGTGSHAAQTLGSILAFCMQTCLQAVLTIWPRGCSSSFSWLGQPQNGTIPSQTYLLLLAFTCCWPPSCILLN